jgi:hypothetical protein
MAKLRQLRRLREFGITVGKLNPDPASKVSLHKWRKAEVVTDESLINRVNSPLSCGDVFQKKDSSKHYVLLRQPCDLMVRGGEGKTRTATEAVFSLIEIDQPTLKEKDSEPWGFRLEGVGKDGKTG